jgi:hypothetical protein
MKYLAFILLSVVVLSCKNNLNSNITISLNTEINEPVVIEINDWNKTSYWDERSEVYQKGELILSQIAEDPITKERILLVYPDIKEKLNLEIKKGGNTMVQFKPLVNAELWIKTGGEFIDNKYVGGNFTEVDFLRVPNDCTDHSYYIKYEGPGWESNKVGYRFYLDWRNAVDVFGKKTSQMALKEIGQDGYDSYHEMQDWGMDILKVGKSLGIGSIGYYDGEKALRVEKTDSLTCRVKAKGPIRAIIETNYYGWQTNDFKTNVTSFLSIDANSRLSKQVLKFDNSPENICTGIYIDKNCEAFKLETEHWVALATWGIQSLNADNLGLVVFVPKEMFVRFDSDSLNHLVVLKPENNIASWYFGAAWELEPNGVKTYEEFKGYIESQLKILNNPSSIILN